MSKLSNVVFAKDGAHNLGNIQSNTINIKSEQEKTLTNGTLWIPIFEDANGPYICRVMRIVSEPKPAEYPTVYNAQNLKADYSKCVKVKTIIETMKKHYLSKSARVRGWGQLTYGNTVLNEGTKGNAQKALFNEFKNYLSFAIREI